MALDAEYITKLEERKGRPARLVVGDPLPKDREVLPEPGELNVFTYSRFTQGIDTPPSLLRRSGGGLLMHVGELLFRLSEAGITLTCGRTEDRLNAKPTAALTPELVEEIRQHKMEIIQIMREDEEMRRTGIIQSHRQVFEMAREYFGLNEKGGAA